MPKMVNGGFGLFEKQFDAKYQKKKGAMKFSRKKRKNEKFEQSHSAEQSEREDPWDF